MNCPLCLNKKDLSPVSGPAAREYYLCPECMLIFVADEFLPSPEAEKERYLLHENTLMNKGYVDFLNIAILAAEPYYFHRMRILDYGCGPNPVLSQLLSARGMDCLNYDPFFFPAFPGGKFDIIFSIETIEHFFQPAIEFGKLSDFLAPGGVLIIMTALWDSTEKFSSWSYARDNTHVRFYHRQSIRYISKEYGYRYSINKDSRVIVFENKA